MDGGAEFLVVRHQDGRQIDLRRDVHALFGLAFDATDLTQTVALLRRCATQRERCTFATVNVNWAVAAREDPDFRQSVLRSDLCVADGMPLVWMASALGVPLRQRVAGSELFERLRATANGPGVPPIRVYFFGGPAGAAQAATVALNGNHSGMVGVGFDAAGFGSIEEMSSPSHIEPINASCADFVVVSLGARKGQAWIVRNLPHLAAPVVSHLGAVVNFVAGTLRPAPKWLRRVGFEWLWRVLQEPELWRRYAHDGAVLVKYFVLDVMPWILRRRRLLANAALGPGPEYYIDETGTVHLRGHWYGASTASLRADLATLLWGGRRVELDLSEATSLDSALVGLLLVLQGWQAGPAMKPGSASASAVRCALRAMGCGEVAS
jgi:N-acetylglucosaminyldiphosphoundecaprenol N-acetyl-beta-D-mannosaminyltransferase